MKACTVVKLLKKQESGLVVGWFDVFKTLIFVGFCFVFIGPIPDAMYSFIHTAPVGFFTQQDLDACDALYAWWKYILFVVLGVVFIYIMNYANTKRGEN